MKIIKILKKHYLATAILGLSVGIIGYTVSQKPTPKNPLFTLNSTSSIQNSIEPNKNSQPKLQIPEIIKPTSTEKKEVESASAVNQQSITQQEIGIPIDLTQGTFIINDKSYPVSFVAHQSVYEVMKQLNDSGQIKVDFKDYSGLGYFVDGIDGIKSDTLRAKYWIYYINGAKAQVGISNYELKSKDIVTWKYESAE